MTRPRWVWVISMYYLCMFVFSYLALFLVLSNSVSVPEQIRARIENLTAIAWVVLVVQSFIAVSGAMALLFLRKIAYYLFITGFGIGSAWILWRSVSLMSAMGMAILAAVCLYTRKLRREGTLT